MKKNHNVAMAAGTGLLAAALVASMAAPVYAAEAPSSSVKSSSSVTLDAEQVAELTPEQEAMAADVTKLTSAVDQASNTVDLRKVSADLAVGATAQSFVAEYSANGGSVINADGSTTVPSAPAKQLLEANSAAQAQAQGRIWQDAWGAHMTVPKETMDRLATLAATGSGAAGAVAALLAANIEGFPISTTGALASGAVAVGLIAAAGALQLCNINGNGAQANFNWVVWTCWPL